MRIAFLADSVSVDAMFTFPSSSDVDLTPVCLDNPADDLSAGADHTPILSFGSGL